MVALSKLHNRAVDRRLLQNVTHSCDRLFQMVLLEIDMGDIAPVDSSGLDGPCPC